MPGLLIKNVPPEIHERLKEDAVRHHRSMTKHALTLIERGLLPAARALKFPKPIRGLKPLTPEFITRAIREGRA